MFLEKKPSVYLYEMGMLLARGFCKHALAKRPGDKPGEWLPCSPLDPRAECWCMAGAMIAVGVPMHVGQLHTVELYLESALCEVEVLSKARPGELIETANDSSIWNQTKALAAVEAAFTLARENDE